MRESGVVAHTSFHFRRHFARSFLFAGLIAIAASIPALAQDVTADDIIKALTPEQPAVTGEDRAFIDGLRHHTRSLTVDEGDHVAALKPPQIDLAINFDYNSSVITGRAEPQLNELAKALRDSKLEGSFFLIGGHTDAKGSDQYNQALSQRRAESVKKYLVDKFQIPAENLTTAGYGKRDLKNKGNPFAAENRRVQIVNFGPSNTANR
jgi:outer membrane protein OmpA-like peptidoglycan-associated protein